MACMQSHDRRLSATRTCNGCTSAARRRPRTSRMCSSGTKLEDCPSTAATCVHRVQFDAADANEAHSRSARRRQRNCNVDARHARGRRKAGLIWRGYRGGMVTDIKAETNKVVAQRVIDEIFEKGNEEAIDELIAPDFIPHNWATGGHGPE